MPTWPHETSGQRRARDRASVVAPVIAAVAEYQRELRSLREQQQAAQLMVHQLLVRMADTREMAQVALHQIPTTVRSYTDGEVKAIKAKLDRGVTVVEDRFGHVNAVLEDLTAKVDVLASELVAASAKGKGKGKKGKENVRDMF